MKRRQTLSKGWELIRLERPSARLEEEDLARLARREDALAVGEMPAQVHDILLEHGKIPQEAWVGWCEDVVWVGRCDWVYRRFFRCQAPEEGRVTLDCAGLDTVADLYLDGIRIASHDDFYLPERVEITRHLRAPGAEHCLLIHFHNTYDYLDGLEMPAEWAGVIEKFRLLRKPQHDFPVKMTCAPEQEAGGSYQGAAPFFTPIGVYGEVALETADRAEITGDWLRTSLSAGYVRGEVLLDLCGIGAPEKGRVHVRLAGPDGETAAEGTFGLLVRGGERWEGFAALAVEAPRLWWPRGFGGQALYRLTAELLDGDRVCDRLERGVGFKDVVTDGNLGFTVNGKTVRLWGGSMDPFQGFTHCWREDRVRRLLDMVENAHMNTLRCWGEGIPYDERFYDECDRRGILVWQEFFLGYGCYPDSPEYRARYRAEASRLIRRLRHRASLLLWCGGNETRMGAEYEGKPFFGERVVAQDFPQLVARLDPGRCYHESSPSGGRWANDPLTGDHHTYDCIWQYPGCEYPNFVSEDIRTAPPALHSLRRFIRPERFWPSDFTGAFPYARRYPLPDGWMDRVCLSASMDLKTGPIGEFYDGDTPENLIYQFGAAYGKVLRRTIERVRMGSREGGHPRERRSRGHFSCKLNDTWPKIYCAVIDYFQEGYIPYYTTRRAQAPVLVCFDIRDERICLWLVNDGPDDVSGAVTFRLYDLPRNRFVCEKTVPASMPQGCSDIVLDLDFLGFFRKYHLLCAEFRDAQGRLVHSAVDFVDIERHLRFPQAPLTVRVDGGDLLVTADRFARCVEITGDDGGDAFGWMFEDNYFDLLPGQEKRVRVLGSHDRGTVRLKPHYNEQAVQIDYDRTPNRNRNLKEDLS